MSSASSRVDRSLRKHGASTVGPLERRRERLDRFREFVLKSIKNDQKRRRVNELDEEENRLIDSVNDAWDVYINSNDRMKDFDLVCEALCKLDDFYQSYNMKMLAYVSSNT